MELAQHHGQGFYGVEHAGGDGDEQNIVAEGPEQVLPDRAHGGPAEADGQAHIRLDESWPVLNFRIDEAPVSVA